MIVTTHVKISFSTCVCHIVLTLQVRMNHSRYLLTRIEVSVFGELFSHSVKLFGVVVTTVAVKLDTGGEVYHQGGQGGDLLQNRLILLQQGGYASCDM